MIGFGQRANRYYGSAGVAKLPDITHPHPHNAALELWIDLGCIGVSLFGLVPVILGYATRNINPRLLPAVTATTAASFSHAMTGAGFLQGWYVASLSMVVIALIAIGNSSSEERKE